MMSEKLLTALISGGAAFLGTVIAFAGAFAGLQLTTRNEFIRKVVVVAAAAPLLMGARKRRRSRSGAMFTGEAPTGLPNLVLIFTDDQAPHTVYQMSKTLQIFAVGANLTEQAYVPVPACGPARNALLMGRYPHNTGIIRNDDDYSQYRKKGYPSKDLLSRLRRVGYRVGYFGKFMNDYTSSDGSQDWVHPACRRKEGGRWVALAGQNHKGSYWINANGHTNEYRENQSRLFARYAAAWTRECIESGDPFVLIVAEPNPHVPHTPTQAHQHSFDGARYVSPGTDEDTREELADKSDWSHRFMGRTGHQRAYEGQLEELATIESELMGPMFGPDGLLTTSGVLGNTLMFYATDNGYLMGEHGGMKGKGKPFQESVKTPFLVRGPRVPSGFSAPGKLVSIIDITATFLDVASADMSGVDGRSLLPLFANPQAPWRERLLVAHQEKGWNMLREGDFAYFDLPGGERELYNVTDDPYQLENVAASMPNLCSEMQQRLNDIKASAGDALRAAEEQ